MSTVTTGAPAEVLTLPRTAIVYSLYGDNVFVVKPAAAAAAPTAARRAAGAQRPRSSSGASCASARRAASASPSNEGVQGGRAGGHRRPDQAAGQFARRHRRRRRAAAARRNAEAVTADADERLHRPLHPPAGAGERGQPADPAHRRDGGTQAADPAVSGDVQHDDHHHHDLSRRRRRRDQGLHHDADRTGGREHRRHRHAGLDLAAERLDDHAQPAARRQSRPRDGRHAVEGQPGARPAAARGERSGRRQADRAGLRADVPVVQLEA